MKGVILFASIAVIGLGQNGGVPARMIVTVETQHGANPPSVAPQDLQVYHDQKRLQATDLKPVRTTGLELWILIDDGSDASIGNQFSEIRKFVGEQPGNFEIGIGYMRNGSVTVTQPLSTDHELSGKALRLPLAEPGISGSPYTTLVDLIHKWPQTTRAREVLMVTSGIDPLYGPGPENPYLARAIEEAQRGGIVVSSLYYGSGGHLGHSYWQINWGQNNLSELADTTGGEFYWQGTTNPVSLAPYLDQFNRRLGEQYEIAFDASCKPGLETVKVRTELPHISLVAPARVGLPGCSGRTGH